MKLERGTRIELATTCLEGRSSTTELPPLGISITPAGTRTSLDGAGLSVLAVHPDGPGMRLAVTGCASPPLPERCHKG